jgi:hypothetical protein
MKIVVCNLNFCYRFNVIEAERLRMAIGVNEMLDILRICFGLKLSRGTKGLLWPRCIGLSQWVRTPVFYLSKTIATFRRLGLQVELGDGERILLGP